MNRRVYIVVEGKDDVNPMKQALSPSARKRSRVVDGGGRGAVVSQARTLLVRGDGPVALVTGVEDNAEGSLRDQYATLSYLLGSVAVRERWEVFLLTRPLKEILNDADERRRLLTRLESFVLCEIEKGQRVQNKDGEMGVSLDHASGGKVAVRTYAGNLDLWNVKEVKVIAPDYEEIPLGVF